MFVQYDLLAEKCSYSLLKHYPSLYNFPHLTARQQVSIQSIDFDHRLSLDEFDNISPTSVIDKSYLNPAPHLTALAKTKVPGPSKQLFIFLAKPNDKGKFSKDRDYEIIYD